MKDTDWLYKAVTVPWLSHDRVNLVEISGFGFDSIFDETNEIMPRSTFRLEGWEFVAVWRAEFPGWNMICWLIFRRRAG
jgi:hypothetical protein